MMGARQPRHSSTGSAGSQSDEAFEIVPGAVKNLNVVPNPNLLSVTLQWAPPDDHELVRRYHIQFHAAVCRDATGQRGTARRPLNRTATAAAVNDNDFVEIVQVITGSVESVCNEVTLDRTDGLQPLLRYTFQVQAESRQGIMGAIQQVTASLDLYCRLPSCNERRIFIDPTSEHCNLYDFCCKWHKIEFERQYCLYSECKEEKDDDDDGGASSSKPVHQTNHFCSEGHRLMAKRSGATYLVWLDPSSREFNEVSGKFTKTWCTKKGDCPTVFSVLAIINPVLEENLNSYRETLPKGHRGTEMYFHGTRLACSLFLDDYHMLCSKPHCGICNISKNGFLATRIRTHLFQRFGNAFYLAPNSSKSHDYCKVPNYARYTAMLFCEVAPGVKYILRTNMTSLQEPPQGHHSVYGKSKFLFRKSVLNYDELVVYEPAAICPRYILFYR